MKMKKFWARGGRASLVPPLDPPLNRVCGTPQYSSFSQLHKIGNVGIGVHENYISTLHALLDWFIFNDRSKTKLAMLPFLY